MARALLADFPVLILDEPAEHLDPLAADALTADVLDVTDGRSLVLITHRLAGLEAVDEILVMDAGRVVEHGTHDELLEPGRTVLQPVVGGDAHRALRPRSPDDPLLSAPPDTADGTTAEGISSDGIFIS